MHGDEATVGVLETPEHAFQVMDIAGLERERAEAALQELQRIKDEFAKARESFAEADTFYQRARKDWESRFRDYEQRLLKVERERDDHARLAELLTNQRDQLAREVERITEIVATIVGQRDEYAHQLADATTQLRPYRIIDRLGVIGRSYGLARRIKRRLVS